MNCCGVHYSTCRKEELVRLVRESAAQGSQPMNSQCEGKLLLSYIPVTGSLLVADWLLRSSAEMDIRPANQIKTHLRK